MLTFSTLELRQLLIAAGNVAEKRTTIPVLSHVRIETCSQGACFSATDLAVSRQEWLKRTGPDTDWPTWQACVDVQALKNALPKTVKACKAAPTVNIWLDGGYRETARKMTPAECADYRKDCPPKLSDGCYAGKGEMVGKRLAIFPDKQWTDAEVRAMAGQTIVTSWDGKLRIEVGGAECALRSLDPVEFPTLPTPEKLAEDQQKRNAERLAEGKKPEAEPAVSEPAVIGGKEWREMIGKVFHAMSSEESRFQLSGAQIELNGKPVAIATDGHRLVKAIASGYETEPAEDMEFLAPHGLLFASQKDWALGPVKTPQRCGEYKAGKRKGEPKFRNVDSWPSVRISVSKVHVFLTTARGVRYASRILEGTFPDYERVICKEAPACEITTTAGDLSTALHSVAHMTGDRARAVRLEIGEDFPRFTAQNPDRGQASVSLNGSTTVKGQLREIPGRKAYTTRDGTMMPKIPAKPSAQHLGINPDYLLDICKTWDSDCLLYLRLQDENSQMVIHSEADPSYRAIIMPVRL